MKFDQIASGSFANAYLLTARNGNRLLIEAGLPLPRLLKGLQFNLRDIIGCLISHEHGDHAKSAVAIWRSGIPIYASEGTLGSLNISGRNVFSLRNEKVDIADTFQVYSFATQHDATEPLGFIIREIETGEYFLFATDTAYLEVRFRYPWAIIAIECSYHIDVLNDRVKQGLINETLAKRLLFTHMEFETTRKYLIHCCNLIHCRQIHLVHCSRGNLDIHRAAREIQNDTFIETIIK